MRCYGAIKIPERAKKPRSHGITMVLDKNMSISSVKGLFEMSGEYIDLYKIAWGTSALYKEEEIRKKINLCHEYGILVYPGGTLFEIAYMQNKVDEFFKETLRLGFNAVEISDGVVSIPHNEKIEFIIQAKEYGLTTFSEIGKKTDVDDSKYNYDDRVSEALKELECGSDKIIIESRESGSSGVFDKDHNVKQDFFEKLISSVGLRRIIIEAPIVDQQKWLISNHGHEVNLGNISPHDCFNLESLRVGLRADTVKKFHGSSVHVSIVNGIIGSLDASDRNDLIIVVDALRASSTIVTALEHGVSHISTSEFISGHDSDITVGERSGLKINSFDYDNSPLTFKSDLFSGKSISLNTTNGTECINACLSSKSPVLIGSLLNASAVASVACKLSTGSISIVMAGRNNNMASEDLITASEIFRNIKNGVLTGYIDLKGSSDFERDFILSDSGKNLISLGKEGDVLFCAQSNIYSTVPIVNKDSNIVKYK